MILIKNVQVVDGAGKAAYKADVLINNDKISAIGSFPNKEAEVVIDGLGYYLTPGFIDVNTDSDHYLSLFTNPAQEDFLTQGVTTIIGGQCGSSLAPLLYGSLESIQKWGNPNLINVDWHTVDDFLTVLKSSGLGINFGTLVGHSTIRRALIGEGLRDLSGSELKVLLNLLARSLEEGALGLSAGLGYVHSKNVSYEEIKSFAKIVEKYNGVFAVHLRDEKEKLADAVSETIQLSQETGAKTLVSHFRPLIGYERNFEQALNLIETAANKLDFHFDGYPFDSSVVPLYALLPIEFQTGGWRAMLDNISNKATQEKIIKGLPILKESDIIIASAPQAKYLTGKSLGQFAKNREIDLSVALLELMKATQLQAVIIYKNINLDLAIRSLTSEKGLVASNGASLRARDSNQGQSDSGLNPALFSDVFKYERFYNTFPKFLDLISKVEGFSLENAIKKLTSVPARKFNLKNRGVIKEGNQADAVMIKDNKIHHVFVNGKWAVKAGQFQNGLAGQIIRR